MKQNISEKPPYESLKNGDISIWNKWKMEHSEVQIELKGVNREGVNLEGANLQDAILERSNLSNANLHYANLKGANLHEANLKGTNLHESHLEGVDMHHAELNGANLRCVWIDNETNCKETLFGDSSFSINSKCIIEERILFEILSEASVNNIQFIDPVLGRKVRDEAWLYHFKLECEKSRFKRFFLWLWEKTCNYGRNIWKWCIISLLISFIFALFYTPCPDFFPDWWKEICNTINIQFEQTSKSYEGTIPNLLAMWYFSIVTFTTLGFGDIVAASAMARLLVTFEVIIGYIMLGGLISIFANKLARRND